MEIKIKAKQKNVLFLSLAVANKFYLWKIQFLITFIFIIMKNIKSFLSCLLSMAICFPLSAKKKHPVGEEKIRVEILPDEKLAAEINRAQGQLEAERDIYSKGIFLPYYDMALGFLVDQTVGAVKKALKKRKDSYKAVWKAGTTSYFYRDISFNGFSDPTGMQFGGFNVLRMISALHQPQKTDTAFYMACHLNKNDLRNLLANGQFELILDTLQIDLSRTKAKLPPFHLCNVEIVCTVSSSWFTVAGDYKKDQELGKFILAVKNLRYDPAHPIYRYTSEKEPFIPGSCRLIPRSATCLVKKSNTNEEHIIDVWGRGDFRLAVEVKEETIRKSNEWMEKVSVGIIETTGKELKSDKIF